MSVDPNFSMTKRFDTLHMRYILYLQDSLGELQQRLDACDDAEDIQLYLSSRRNDENETRRDLMKELGVQLRNYGPNVPSFTEAKDLSFAGIAIV